MPIKGMYKKALLRVTECQGFVNHHGHNEPLRHGKLGSNIAQDLLPSQKGQRCQHHKAYKRDRLQDNAWGY